MVEIAPFKGITYNKKKIQPLDQVMSPPYDIISDHMQNELYDKHPNNFVRLILGKHTPNDTEQDNRYTRAKHLFTEWQKQSILTESEKNAVYPYKITYQIDNETKTMNGFFTLLKLDPSYQQVKAHEKTLAKPKADRLNLLRDCQAHLEPIQLLYMDKNNTIQELLTKSMNNPLIDVTGYDGFTHTLWKTENEQVIETIQQTLKDKILFIADGHHRYQTAINYAKEMQEKTGNTNPNAPFHYQMVILANIFDEGLMILPTHRLIKMKQLKIDAFLKQLQVYFTIEKQQIQGKTQDYETIGQTIIQAIKTKDKHKFALYSQGIYYILTLKDETIMDQLASDHSKTWRTLDVSILHKIILEKILGINENNIEDHVKYIRSNGEAIQRVNEGKFDLSFLMNATKINELKAIAEAGEHMPQKSTYFLPKMLSGLVMYKM